VFVVTNDAVTLVDRAGAVQKTYSSPREITAAAFDGSSLAIFDKAMLTIFASNLTPVAPASMLTEVCAAAAFVGGDRVICGSASDWQRSFYAYSSKTGAKILATLMSETYHGIPMRRVTGKDDFVTVSIGTSPSDFFLHTVDSSSKVIYVSDSPYHGDFAVSLAYTLQGNPAHHLVTEQGLLLNIYDVNCKAGLGSPQCFVKDGMLGTLFGTQRFIGMDNDGTNYVYALVDDASSTSFYRRCANGCFAQRINGDQKVVEAQKRYDVDVGAIIATRHDATANALIVGFRKSGSFSVGDPYPGYRVELLTYQ